MANSCPKATSFFGVVQRIYLLFSSSPKRWKVLKDNVEGLMVKPLSETHWESRVESVKIIRYQAPQIRDALVELAHTTEDPKTKNDAESLAEHGIGSFEFLVGMIIWQNLLFAINSISKVFQNEDMHIDVAVDQLKGLIAFIEKYRETGFVEAMIEAKEVAARMNVEPAFQEK